LFAVAGNLGATKRSCYIGLDFLCQLETAIFDQEGFEKYKPKKFVELVEGFVEYQYPT